VTSLLHRYGTVPSTMDLLHRLAAEGAAAGTAVVAEEQESGRGSRGRSWDSAPGGLWLSFLLRPATAATGLLSLRAGLAAGEALERLGAGETIGIKWPNDLMLGGRKLGGILCEARWAGDTPAWVAIGLGINVRNPIPPELGTIATSLAETLPAAEPDAVLEVLLPALAGIDGHEPALCEAELARLTSRDWLLGRRLAQPVAGRADGIDTDGALRIRGDDGTLHVVRAGTVELAGRAGRP
jgi:BirA family biotin operon repressor/biotin-[acetyl-CoA-carboxylase] ligase